MLAESQNEPTRDTSATHWQRYAWVVMAVAPYILLAIRHWSYLPGIDNGDYAQYLSHAKALAEGRPYGDIGYLFTRYNALVSPVQQPPGWPLILTPGVAIFGTGFGYPKAMSLLAGLVFLALAAWRISRVDNRWIAIGALAITGVALEEGFETNAVLSDLPFAALVWTFLMLADRDGPMSWRRLVLLAGVGTYAMSTRVLGIAIVPTVALFALMKTGADRRRLLGLAGAWVLIAIVAIMVMGADRVPFLTQTLREPSILLGRLDGNLESYRLGPLSAVMYPFPWGLANDLYHGSALILMAIGVVDVVRRFWHSATGTFVVCYLALLAVSPVADRRYLWPLWPLLSYAMIAGARRLSEWRPFRALGVGRLVAPAVVALVLTGFITSFRARAPDSLLDREDVQGLFAWLRSERARGDLRVVFSRARVLTLETGVPAMPTFQATDERMFRELDRAGITHAIAGDAGISHPATRPFEAFVRRHPGSFVPAWSNSGFSIYRYVGGAARGVGAARDGSGVRLVRLPSSCAEQLLDRAPPTTNFRKSNRCDTGYSGGASAAVASPPM